MNRDLVAIKDKLTAEGEAQAMAVMPFLKLLFPVIDEVTTKEAYEIFGSRVHFDWHRKQGNIQPLKGFSRKSKKIWSRIDIYNLKKGEKMVMKFI